MSHPKGLYLLFATEMWERFSYYGMRALLILYLTKSYIDGGLGFTEESATLIYGFFTGFVYFTPLIGGWLADKFGFGRMVTIGTRYAFSICRSATAYNRKRILQTKHFHIGRQAVRRKRHPPRCRFYHILHGHKHRRLFLSAHHRLSGCEIRVHLRISGSGHRHVHRHCHIHVVRMKNAEGHQKKNAATDRQSIVRSSAHR